MVWGYPLALCTGLTGSGQLCGGLIRLNLTGKIRSRKFIIRIAFTEAGPCFNVHIRQTNFLHMMLLIENTIIAIFQGLALILILSLSLIQSKLMIGIFAL